MTLALHPLALPLLLEDDEMLLVRLQDAFAPPAPPTPLPWPARVHPTTLRLFERLPEVYRVADEALGYPLLRYLSLVGDQLGELADLARRIDYLPVDEGGDGTDTSDLADPTTADAAWLPWLAQLVGVKLDPMLTTAERRDAVAFGSTGWRAGTKQAVADAAKSALTGARFAVVHDHAKPSLDGTTLVAGGEWDVTIVTRTTETPDPAAVLATVVAKGAKPAGVVLHHLSYASTWAQVEALGPWSAIEARGSWVAIEETGMGG